MWNLSTPPGATLLIITMAVGVNVLFSAGRRFLTNVKKSKRVQAEVKAFQKEWREALMKKDKQKKERLSKKKKSMDEAQSKLMMENLRVTFLFMVPLLLLWWLVGGAVGDGLVAKSPIPLNLPFFPIGTDLGFWWWYMIASFAFSGVITKVFGVSLTD